jgi:hypothetical protein
MENDGILTDIELFTDKELGINENDYLDENGHYSGYEYHKDRDYLTFQKFYKKMKPTKEDFNILSSYFGNYSFIEKDYDYSFVKSPSLRHLLFDEPLPQSDKNDPYYPLLDIEIREIMKNLITLLKTTDNQTLKNNVCKKIEQIKVSDYIFTEKEKMETCIPLLLFKKNC